MNNKHVYLPLPEPRLLLPEPDYRIPQVAIDLLEEAGNKAFEVMVEQMRINPDAIEALYG
jgi:hypothetical protein